MITEKDILNHMTSMGKSVNALMSTSTTNGTMLSQLASMRDEMPAGTSTEMFDQLDKSLAHARTGRADMTQSLDKIKDIFKQNGNNSSK
jgi:hypothetical protein